MGGVGNIRVVGAIPFLLYGVRGAKDVEDGAWRNGREPVHVASRRRVEDRRVARSGEEIIPDQLRQPHCKQKQSSPNVLLWTANLHGNCTR